MATWQDLKVTSRFFLERYKYPDLGPPPLSKLSAPIEDSRFLLITTAGLHLKKDPPFSTSFKESDCSYRQLPSEAAPEEMEVSHTSSEFDRRGVQHDLNVVLPVDRMQELAARGTIGSIAETNFSFMGSIPRVEELTERFAPEVAKLAGQEGVHAAILTPV